MWINWWIFVYPLSWHVRVYETDANHVVVVVEFASLNYGYMNMCWFLLNWMKYDVVVVGCWWFHDLMMLLLLWDVIVVEWNLGYSNFVNCGWFCEVVLVFMRKGSKMSFWLNKLLAVIFVETKSLFDVLKITNILYLFNLVIY